MIMLAQKTWMLIALPVLALLPDSASATLYLGQPVQMLARQCNAIVDGTVQNVQVAGRATVITFKTDKILSGTITTSDPLRVLYHRIIHQPPADFNAGDHMILLLTRFVPDRSPYHNVSNYDYYVTGGDSEGAWFVRKLDIPEHGCTIRIQGVHGTPTFSRSFKDIDDFFDWLSFTSDRP